MSFGTDFNMMEARARRLLSEVNQKTLEMFTSDPPPVDHPKFQEHYSALLRWSQEIEQVLKQCGTQQMLLDRLKRNATNGPIPRHNNVLNSIHGLNKGAIINYEGQLASLVKLAEKVRENLARLYTKDADPLERAASLGGNVSEFIKNIDKQVVVMKEAVKTHTTHSTGPEFHAGHSSGALDPGQSHLGDSMVSISILLGLCLKLYQNRRNKRR